MISGKKYFPMPGVELYKNPKNGFIVFQLHYSADPKKINSAEIQAIKEAMPIRLFKQEYELQWDSYEGLAVFADWDITIHGTKQDIYPEIGLPLLLGFDWGLMPACVVCQMQGDTLCVLKEFIGVNMGAERFLAWVTPQLKISFHRWPDFARDYLVFIDPAGAARSQDNEGTCTKVLDTCGFKHIIPGPIDWEERKNSVDYFLTRRTRNGPCFKVSIANCPILTKGFQGGYRYNDKVMEIEPNKLRPLKDLHSHVMDALQMVTGRILITKPAILQDIPRLSYSLNDDHPIDNRFMT